MRPPCVPLPALLHARADSCVQFIHGFAAGPGETYPGMVISDIVFIDHRGFWLGCYWGMYFSSQMVGPIVGGVMAQKYGWRR